MFTRLQGLKALGIPLGPRRALVLRYGRSFDVSRQADGQISRTSSSAIPAADQFGRTSSGISVGTGVVSARMGGGGQQPMAVETLTEISRAVQFADVSGSFGPSGGALERTESGSRRAGRINIADHESEVVLPHLCSPTAFHTCMFHESD